MKFPLTLQDRISNCGPSCLKMITEYYSKSYDLDFLSAKCRVTKTGTSILRLSKVAKSIGFECRGVKMGIEQLKEIVQQIPVILYWSRNHFVIIYKAPKPSKQGFFYLADPAKGLIRLKEPQFARDWLAKKNGCALLIECAFTASSFVSAGSNSAYSGEVSVSGFYLNPADENLEDYIPGDLRGIRATSGAINMAGR